MKQPLLRTAAVAALSSFIRIAGATTSLSPSSLAPLAGVHPLAFSAAPCYRRHPSNRIIGCCRPLTSCAPTNVHARISLSTSPFNQGDGFHDGRSLLLTHYATNDDNDGNISNDSSVGKSENETELTKEVSNEQSAKENVGVTNKPKPEPPRLLAAGYSMASFLNIVAGLFLLCNIGIISKVAISSSSVDAADILLQSTRYQRNILATYTAGALGHLFLAAGSCNILSGAANKSSKRLYTSNTYKRLTMGTLLFGFLGLFSLPGEAGCITSSTTICGAAFVTMQLAKFATAFVSFVGWEYSAGGFGLSGKERIINIAKEVGRGFKGLYKALPVSEERPPTFYRTFFILVMLGNLVFNLPELVFNLQQGGIVAGMISLPVSLTISSVARLGLLSTLLFILKDAAERKRLEGTTFVKLNMVVGFWALGVGIAQGMIDGPTMPFKVRRAADKLLFALLFLNNGILSQLSKMGIIKKRDVEEDPDADPPLRIIF